MHLRCAEIGGLKILILTASGLQIRSNGKTTVAIRDTGSNYKSKAVLINESGLYSPFSRICNPAASNIRIFNPYTARVSRAFRRICRSNDDG